MESTRIFKSVRGSGDHSLELLKKSIPVHAWAESLEPNEPIGSQV